MVRKAFKKFLVVAICCSCSAAAGQSVFWNRNGGGQWDISSNWSPAGVPNINDDVYFNFDFLTPASEIINLNADQSAHQIVFRGYNGTISIENGNGGNHTLTIGAGGIDVRDNNNASMDRTISARIALAASQPWRNESTGRTLKVSGAVSLGGFGLDVVGPGGVDVSGTITGNGGLNVYGGGTLALSGANTYSGNTSINTGSTVQIANPNALAGSTVVLSGSLAFASGISLPSLGGLSGTANLDMRDTSGNPVYVTVGGNNVTTAYSGIISGTGSFTKVGGGSLTLSGNNTFTSGMFLNGGTLQISTDSNLGAASSNLQFNGGTLQLSVAGTFFRPWLVAAGGGAVDTMGVNPTFNGPIVGSAGLTKVGLGTLTLGAANSSFTGGMTINAGSVRLGDPNALVNSTVAVNVDDGLRFLAGTTLPVIGALAGNSALGLQDSISTAVFPTVGGNNATTTYSGVISGTGGLTKAGTGRLTLSGANTFYGDFNATGGVIMLANSFAAQNATLDYQSYGGSIQFGAPTAYLLGGIRGNQSLALTGAGGSVALTVGSNNTNTTYSGVLSGGGSVRKVGFATLTLNGANSYTGTTTIDAGAIQIGNPNALLNSSVFVNADSGLRFSAGNTLPIIGALAGSGALSLQDATSNAVFVTAGGNNASTTYSGVISGLGGITKAGVGTLTLSGANTFYGDFNATGGVILLANSFAAQNATLDYQSFGGSIQFGTPTAYLLGGIRGNQSLALAGAGGSIALTVGSNNSNTTYSGVLSGGGSVRKIGFATLTLAGPNLYTGDTTIDAGAIQLAHLNAERLSTMIVNANNGLTFAAGTTSLNIGGLAGTGNIVLQDAVGAPVELTVGYNNASSTYSGVLSGPGSLNKLNFGTLTLSAPNLYTGNTTIGMGTIELAHLNAERLSTIIVNSNNGLAFATGTTAINLGGLAGTGSIVLQDGAGAPVDLSVGYNNVSTTYSGVLSGPGSLNKLNFGTLTLAGPNLYTGTTTIGMGIIQLAHLNAERLSTVIVNSNNGLAFATGTTAINLGGLAGTGSIVLQDGAGAPVDLSVGYNNVSTTYNGVLSGLGGLNKVNFGALTLSGTNTFAGGTTIVQGSIRVSADSNLGNSAGVLRFAGGTLTTLAGITSSRPVILDGAGGAIDTNGFDSTFNGSITGSGSLTKIGTGHVTFGGLHIQPGEVTIQSTLAGGGASPGGAPRGAQPAASTGVSLIFNTVVDRDLGGSGNFVVTGGVNGVTNAIVIVPQQPGFISQGTFFGGSDFAWYDAAGYVRGINYSFDPNSATVIAADNFVKLTASTTLSSSVTLRTLNLGSAANVSLGANQVLGLSNSGLLKSGGGAPSLISGGGGIMPGINGELVVRTDLASDVLTIATPILATGVNTNALTKSGAGTLILTASSSFSQGTIINGGTVVISDDSNLGDPTGGVTFAGGTLAFANNMVSARTITLSSPGGTIDTRGYNATFSGQFTGPSGLIKTGLGTLTMSSGVSSYTGGTTVTQGTIRIQSDASLGNPAGGLALVGGSVQTAASVNSSRPIAIDAAGGTIDTNGFDSIFGGSITAAGPLTKSGGGTLTLGGDFRGPLTITAGAVVRNGGSSTATLVNNSTFIHTAGTSNDNVTNNGAYTQNGGTNGSIILNNGTVTQNGGELSGVITNYGTFIYNGGTLSAALTNGPHGHLQTATNSTLTVTTAWSFPDGSISSIDGGNLKFDVSTGPSVGTGAAIAVSNSATLELAGPVSALATGDNPMHRVNIVNNSLALAGLLVTGTNQFIGAILGAGTLRVEAGASLHANGVMQGAIEIGGSMGSSGAITIDASDSFGNTNADPLNLGAIVFGSPLSAAGTSSLLISPLSATDSIDFAREQSAVGLGGWQSMGDGSVGRETSVPEPSAIVLALIALAAGMAALSIARRRGLLGRS